MQRTGIRQARNEVGRFSRCAGALGTIRWSQLEEAGVTEKKRILCYGDSLTWGWIPMEHAYPSRRYPFEQRWTGIMAGELGSEYEILEEGLSGRTTNADDPTDPRLNGARYLPSALASHLPLDLVIFMLGTNDTKAYFNRNAFDIAVGMSVLIGQVAASAGGIGTTYPAPAVLLVAPPPLGEMSSQWFADLYMGGREKIIELATRYQALAAFLGLSFVDAGTIVAADGVDGIHFTGASNAALGVRLAEEVKATLRYLR